MRSISLLVLAGLVAVTCGFFVFERKVKTSDTAEFVNKQKSILEVLQHIHQNEILIKLYEESKLWHFEDHYDLFKNVEVVRNFITVHKDRLLPMNEIFTIYNEDHRRQTISLCNVFYNAKDFETFYKSLIWARFHVNEGMFIYALTVAVFHRADTRGIELPAPYEIYPFYFFNAETIQAAQNYKMQGFLRVKKVEDVHTITIQTNYTDFFDYSTMEKKLSYFTEDIGLNTFYYYLHVDFPFWMDGESFNMTRKRRGEQFLFNHQQLLARYYLERLSNDMGTISEFSFNKPINTGYNSRLRYYNGAFFSSRDNDHNINTDSKRRFVEEYDDKERRIRDAIARGNIILEGPSRVDLTKSESIEYLGNLMAGNTDSVNPRFYGNLISMAKMLLGGSVMDRHTSKKYYNLAPSVLEHYETTLRDPVFWQLYKRIISFYWQFKDTLPYYTKSEIMFDGIKILGVEMGQLVTFYDKFDSDITNAVGVELVDKKTVTIEKTSELFKYGKVSHYNGDDFVIKARQSRLNHMPFTFNLHVHSDHDVKSVVRIFLGPKYDQFGHVYDINENRENWVLLDMFKYDLVVGDNIITRDSHEYTWYVKDTTSYFDLYKTTMLVNEGKSKWPLTDHTEPRFGMPNRLMLPKGKKGGMPFQFFFIVTPYMPSTSAYYVDALPFGYPFDRPIDESHWYTPNMYYYDTNIFHKKEIEINTVQP